MTGSGPRSGFRALVFFTAALVWLAPARAQSAEAERLRAAIENRLADLQAELGEGLRLSHAGVEVRDDGSVFHIVVRDVAVSVGGVGGIGVGDIEAVAAALPNDRYAVTGTLPESMEIRGESGAVTGSVTIGKQRFEGVWTPEIDAFNVIETSFEDIRLTTSGDPLVRLGEVALSVAFQETAPRSWSGPAILRVVDIDAADAEGTVRFSIDLIEARGYGEGMNFAEQLRFTREMQALAKRIEAAPEPTGEDAAAIFELLETMPRPFESMRFEWSVTGFEFSAPGTSVALGESAVTGEAGVAGEGKWDVSSAFRVADFAFADANTGGRISLGSLEIGQRIDGIALAEIAASVRELAAPAESDIDAPGEGTDDLTTLADVLAAMPRVLSAMSWGFEVEDFSFREAAVTPEVNIARALYLLAFTDLGGERSNIEMRYEHDGLAMAAGEDMPGELVPDRMVLEIVAADLPNEALWQALVDSARELAVLGPDDAQTVLAYSILAALSEAASELRLLRLNIEAPGFSVEAAGALRADVGALYSLTGELDAKVGRLDELVASLSATPQDEEKMGIAGFLALFQALGAPEADDSGPLIRRYRVELQPDGALLLNGNDLQAVVGAVGGQQGLPPPPN